MKTNCYRILVLDDERTILDLFRKILCPVEGSYASNSRPSFDLTLAERSEEAVEAVRASVEEGRPFAMASHRPYRPALGIDKALEEISQKRAVLYDPDAVDASLRLFTEKGFEFR